MRRVHVNCLVMRYFHIEMPLLVVIWLVSDLAGQCATRLYGRPRERLRALYIFLVYIHRLAKYKEGYEHISSRAVLNI